MKLLHKIGISRYMMKHLKKVSLVSSRKLQRKVVSGAASNIVALKGTAVDIAPSASIEMGTGKLILNDSWCNANPFRTLFSMREQSRLIVHGTFSIYSNADISINEGAVLEIGSGFVNHGARIHCFNSIKIGEHVYIGDDVAIRDSDGHAIVGSENPMTMPIIIEDHVWIGAKVTILKGVKIGEGSVVAAGALVTKDVPTRCMVAGVPAKVIKEGVQWQ